MKFIKRLVAKWAREATEENNFPVKAVSVSDDTLHSDANLNFKVYHATGGYVMEFRRYDRKTDRMDNQIYVISKEEDLGERVARIVNLEMMK
jgi:hypothetical protein